MNECAKNSGRYLNGVYVLTVFATLRARSEAIRRTSVGWRLS